MTGDTDDRAKRALRRRIERNRRRIDARLHAARYGVMRFTSWQTLLDWVWREVKDVWTDSTPDPAPPGGESP